MAEYGNGYKTIYKSIEALFFEVSTVCHNPHTGV
jgi:hypothetical protein